jgi:hypothetical protein
MAARRQTDQENSPVNRFGGAEEDDIQRYLDLTDDGELARIAAMMAPKGGTFDARTLIEQAAALQAEAAAELVRRREARVESMSLATLSELARRLGVHEPGFLGVIHEDSLMDDDPILGPVLRCLSARMRAMPPPQDFANLFLAENPNEALNRASGRTSLRRPPPDANLEELLRFAANIPGDEVSWDILNGAFLDFLQIWFQDRLDLEELIQGGSDSGSKKSKASTVLDRIKGLQRNRTRFYESFKPGQEFPPYIVELAQRAYTECWEDGTLRSRWHQRQAWLAEEFPPFWQRFGEAYRSINQDQIKAEAEAEAEVRRVQNQKSAKARKSGEAGLQNREANRWRRVTAEFIAFLKANQSNSEGRNLSSIVETYVDKSSTLGGSQNRDSSREFLAILIGAVNEGKDAGYALRAFQRPSEVSITLVGSKAHEKFLSSMTPHQRKEFETKDLVPKALLRNKFVTEEAVRDCLHDLVHALSKASKKKSKK